MNKSKGTLNTLLYRGTFAAVMVIWASATQAVEPQYVNGTKWKVAPFSDSGHGLCTGAIDEVMWIFHANGKVNKGDEWSGTWKSLDGNRVLVKSRTRNGRDNNFQVVFAGPDTLLALDNKGQIYRYGIKWQ